MRCPVCGVETHERRSLCPRCNSVLAATEPAGPPADRSVASRTAPRAATLTVVVVTSVLAVSLLITVFVALIRDSASFASAFGALGAVHVLIAIVAVTLYWSGTQWVTGRSPGEALAGALAARSPGEWFPVLVVLLPALVAAAAGAALITAAVPLSPEPTPTDRGRPVPSLTTPEPSLTPPGPSSSPTGTTDDARSQAEVIDSLLDASAGSRKLLLRALQDAGNCINTVAAAQALDQVADERNTQLQQVRELRVTALRNGTQIQATLLEALTRSVEADRAFARWARGIRAEGCQQDGNYRDGVSASSAARAAKALFCSVWNPVAAGFGLPRRTLEEI